MASFEVLILFHNTNNLRHHHTITTGHGKQIAIGMDTVWAILPFQMQYCCGGSKYVFTTISDFRYCTIQGITINQYLITVAVGIKYGSRIVCIYSVMTILQIIYYCTGC